MYFDENYISNAVVTKYLDYLEKFSSSNITDDPLYHKLPKWLQKNQIVVDYLDFYGTERLDQVFLNFKDDFIRNQLFIALKRIEEIEKIRIEVLYRPNKDLWTFAVDLHVNKERIKRIKTLNHLCMCISDEHHENVMKLLFFKKVILTKFSSLLCSKGTVPINFIPYIDLDKFIVKDEDISTSIEHTVPAKKLIQTYIKEINTLISECNFEIVNINSVCINNVIRDKALIHYDNETLDIDVNEDIYTVIDYINDVAFGNTEFSELISTYKSTPSSDLLIAIISDFISKFEIEEDLINVVVVMLIEAYHIEIYPELKFLGDIDVDSDVYVDISCTTNPYKLLNIIHKYDTDDDGLQKFKHIIEKSIENCDDFIHYIIATSPDVFLNDSLRATKSKISMWHENNENLFD